MVCQHGTYEVERSDGKSLHDQALVDQVIGIRCDNHATGVPSFLDIERPEGCGDVQHDCAVCNLEPRTPSATVSKDGVSLAKT